jgi:hypothetical protein
MGRKTPGEQFTDEETRRRVEATLRAAFSMPPKPQSEMKLGKRKGKRKTRAGKAKNA